MVDPISNFFNALNVGDFFDRFGDVPALTKADAVGLHRIKDTTVPSAYQKITDEVEEYYIDVPGCDRESIDAEEQDGSISIVAKRSFGESKDITYGIRIVPKYDIKTVSTSYTNGVLTVTFKPTAKEEPTVRKITIG